MTTIAVVLIVVISTMSPVSPPLSRCHMSPLSQTCHLLVKGKEFNIDEAGWLEDCRTQPSNISLLSKNMMMVVMLMMMMVMTMVMMMVTMTEVIILMARAKDWQSLDQCFFPYEGKLLLGGEFERKLWEKRKCWWWQWVRNCFNDDNDFPPKLQWHWCWSRRHCIACNSYLSKWPGGETYLPCHKHVFKQKQA